MKYLLDTHTWIWWNMNPKKLSSKVNSLLSNPDNYEELLISAISVWEFCKLLEKERLGISCDPQEWIAQALDMPKLRLVPLSTTIAYLSTTLEQPFHGDPADQLIVATAKQESATILTKDKLIQSYQQVKTLW